MYEQLLLLLAAGRSGSSVDVPQVERNETDLRRNLTFAYTNER
jgi:hypothetical protein